MTNLFLFQFKEWWNHHKVWLMVIGAILITIMMGVFWSSRLGKEDENLEFEVETTETDITTQTSSRMEAYVDIKGAVHHPGVYVMEEGSRIQDVIARAGGFTEDADEVHINLAQKVVDQMVIIVPKVGEIFSSQIPPNLSNGNENSSKQVHLNTATIEELQQLNGIGKRKAESIIQYRTEHGAFQSAEELLQVKGIGQKLFEKIKDEVVVP